MSRDSTPRFYLTARQPLRPEVILLAILLATGSLFGIRYALAREHARVAADNAQSASNSAGSGSSSDDDKDDPNQIDTIVLGDPSEAPVPAHKGNHVSPVHPTILIILPRAGKDFGMIPATPAGRLLYAWLAAFNQASPSALEAALPSDAPAATVAAQLAIRKETGGYNLLSAKEVEPGLLVFRLRDQTAAGNEALGALAVQPDTIPARIASFSLRAVPPPPQPPPTSQDPP